MQTVIEATLLKLQCMVLIIVTIVCSILIGLNQLTFIQSFLIRLHAIDRPKVQLHEKKEPPNDVGSLLYSILFNSQIFSARFSQVEF